MPDFNCNVVDASSRELVEVERFTASDLDTMRARLATIQLPDGMCWGEVRPATSRLFAFGVVYVVEGHDPTDAIECAMAEYLNGELPHDISFEHIAGPFEFHAGLREQVEAPVVLAGTRSTLPRSVEDDAP